MKSKEDMEIVEEIEVANTDAVEKTDMPTKKTATAQLDPVAKILAAEKKVRVRISLTEKERESVAQGKPVEPVTVVINGYKYECKKGGDIEVPQSVYSILEKSHKI